MSNKKRDFLIERMVKEITAIFNKYDMGGTFTLADEKKAINGIVLDTTYSAFKSIDGGYGFSNMHQEPEQAKKLLGSSMHLLQNIERGTGGNLKVIEGIRGKIKHTIEMQNNSKSSFHA